MAGGGVGREMDQTPTWAVAVVCGSIIFISILLEKGLHHLAHWFSKKDKKAMIEALDKIKTELMILGFISLLLTFGQNYIAAICIREKYANVMLPCRKQTEKLNNDQRRTLLTDTGTNSNLNLKSTHRFLAAAPTGNSCSAGKVQLISTNAVHQLHIFIFFLAVFHVASCGLTMALGRAKMRSWKVWEKESTTSVDSESTGPIVYRFTHQTTFVRQNAGFWMQTTVMLYIVVPTYCNLPHNVSLFRQFFRSVRKTEYMVLRHGFITAHLSPGSKFNFQVYIKRSLEDDFKQVVGISLILWASAVIVLLLNFNGSPQLFYISIFHLVIILAVGTKLQAIIAKMAIDIQERQAVVQGIPLVSVTDAYFWFRRPKLVLFLIHFTLFQNAFQLTFFFWIWYSFGLDSCFHENMASTIARICIAIGVQILCSYITLPLYALVSQMGSNIKKSVFDEQTSKALLNWRNQARRKKKARLGGENPAISNPIISDTQVEMQSHITDTNNTNQV